MSIRLIAKSILAIASLALVAAPVAAKVHTVTEGGVKIKVGEPQDFLTQGGLTSLVLANQDATYPMIYLGKDDYWVYISEGGPFDGEHSNVVRLRTNLKETIKRTMQQVKFTGIPDANVNEFNGWKAWLMNLYKINDDEWIGFTHLEDQEIGYKEEFRLALNYSSDGGKSFQHLGFIIAPTIDPAILKRGSTTIKNGIANVGGGPVRWDDTYMYVYFNDVTKPDRSDFHGGIARAKLADVIANARKGKSTEFKKYFENRWEEPGMFGRSADIGPALNHVTMLYNTVLKKWIAFRQKGDFLMMYETADPLDFKAPGRPIYEFPKGYGASVYHTIIPIGQEDLTVSGRDMYVFYRYLKAGTRDYNAARIRVTFE